MFPNLHHHTNCVPCWDVTGVLIQPPKQTGLYVHFEVMFNCHFGSCQNTRIPHINQDTNRLTRKQMNYNMQIITQFFTEGYDLYEITFHEFEIV